MNITLKKFAVAALLILGLNSAVCADVVTKKDVEREVAGAFERSEWTKQEKVAFTLSLVANGLDLASSVMSDSRCEEQNPLLGKSPSNGSLVAVKLLAIGFEYWLYSSPKFRNSNTQWFGYTSAIIHSGIAISNFQNDCY